jgi:hypothetical protein
MACRIAHHGASATELMTQTNGDLPVNGGPRHVETERERRADLSKSKRTSSAQTENLARPRPILVAEDRQTAPEHDNTSDAIKRSSVGRMTSGNPRLNGHQVCCARTWKNETKILS